MKTFFAGLAVSVGLMAGSIGGAAAQDVGTVVATCKTPGAAEECQRLVNEFVAAAKRTAGTPRAFDDLLATLAIALGSEIGGLPPAILTQLADAIRNLSDDFVEVLRGNQAVAAADSVAGGNPVLTGEIEGSGA